MMETGAFWVITSVASAGTMLNVVHSIWRNTMAPPEEEKKNNNSKECLGWPETEKKERKTKRTGLIQRILIG